MADVLFLKPVFKDMIWGGSRLKEDFGYEEAGCSTGECWAVSANPNGDCHIAGGEFDGMTLSSLWESHRELFGNAEGDRFPLLTKIIDAKEDLSIQVHPDDEYAKVHENGSLGKTECWYVLDCSENSSIVIGHNAADKEEMKAMIKAERWSDFIRTQPLHKGDFFQIPPGTLHAIKGGTLILETQENSDITYRVYDYDRLQNGKKRELHIEKSIDTITAPYVETTLNRTVERQEDAVIEGLVSCGLYTVKKVSLEGDLKLPQDKNFMIVSVIDGEGSIDGHKIKKGSNFIAPFGYGDMSFEGNLSLIISYIP